VRVRGSWTCPWRSTGAAEGSRLRRRSGTAGQHGRRRSEVGRRSTARKRQVPTSPSFTATAKNVINAANRKRPVPSGKFKPPSNNGANMILTTTTTTTIQRRRLAPYVTERARRRASTGCQRLAGWQPREVMDSIRISTTDHFCAKNYVCQVEWSDLFIWNLITTRVFKGGIAPCPW